LYLQDVYRWFNCMQIGPCAGWMNDNATLRYVDNTNAIFMLVMNPVLPSLLDNQKVDE
jgi:hypothetical protein